MTDHELHDDDYAETTVLPGRPDVDDLDLEETVVLDEEHRRRLGGGQNPERHRDDNPEGRDDR